MIGILLIHITQKPRKLSLDYLKVMKSQIKQYYHLLLKDYQKVGRKKVSKRISGHQDKKIKSKTTYTTSMVEITNIFLKVLN